MFLRFTFILLLFISLNHAAEYHVDTEADNVVRFISKAPLEEFDGITDAIDGYVLWEGAEMLNKNEFFFQVDLATLDTGIGLRNRHMRENYLETEKYPFASYEGEMVNIDSTDADTLIVNVKGTFSIHGVKNPLSAQGKIVPTTNGYFAKSAFQIKLGDYNIKIPKLMFMKLNEIINIEIQFYTKKVKE